MPMFMGVWRATNTTEVILEAEPVLGITMGLSPWEAITENGEFYYIILVIAVGISQFFQFRLTTHLTRKRQKESKSYKPNPKADKMAKQMGIIMYFFTLLMVFMSFTLISAMSIYLTVSALISIAQAFYTDRVMRKADK
jgi:membrane protein insertase Oxa1/YidC/SpoIIIJ